MKDIAVVLAIGVAAALVLAVIELYFLANRFAKFMERIWDEPPAPQEQVTREWPKQES